MVWKYMPHCCPPPPAPPPHVSRMPCPTNTSVRTVFFFGGVTQINEGPGVGTELIGYQTACPMNTHVRTVFFEDFIFRWTQGGGGMAQGLGGGHGRGGVPPFR